MGIYTPTQGKLEDHDELILELTECARHPKQIHYFWVFWSDEGPAQEDEDASIIQLGTWKQPPALRAVVFIQPLKTAHTYIIHAEAHERRTFLPLAPKKNFSCCFCWGLRDRDASEI